MSCSITGSRKYGRASPSCSTRKTPPPVSVLTLPMVIASSRMTEPSTTPLMPSWKPEMRSFSDIPLPSAMPAASSSAVPNAHCTLGEPYATNVPMAMAMSTPSGRKNSSTWGV